MSHRLRATNKFLVAIYGGAEVPIVIELDHDTAMNMQTKTEFYSEAPTTVVSGKEVKVKAQAVQRHPFRLKLPHIDFVYAQSSTS